MRANCLLPTPPCLANTTNELNSNESSHAPKQNSKSLHFQDIKEDFSTNSSLPSTMNNVVQNSTIVPPKSLNVSTTKPPHLSSSDSNELIRATKERLFELVLNSEPNEIFIEDFLLTFRIWCEKDLYPNKDSKIMANLMNRICTNIRNNVHVENCVRIVLIWLVNHFQDFQNENRYLLDEFENVLKENYAYKTQLRLFYMNLSAKSVERQVTVTRSDRNSSLPFSLIGGYECSARLFIGEILSNQTQNSPQHQSQLDLRPGDRVISINGVDCHVMPIGRAYDLCRSSTHLSLQVKYDPHLFYALIEGNLTFN